MEARVSLRRKAYLMLGGEGHRSPAVKLVDLALMGLICANCVASILESVESLGIMHGQVFRNFDVVSVTIFSVEYGLRLWTAVENQKYRHPLWGRLTYMVTPLALVDLLAVLPFFLGFFV